MPNYQSSYSGTQVDNAVAKALSIPDIDPATDVGKFLGVDENGDLALLDAPSGGAAGFAVPVQVRETRVNFS